jgi:hypothetical protein
MSIDKKERKQIIGENADALRESREMIIEENKRKSSIKIEGKKAVYCRHCNNEIKPSELLAHTWVHCEDGAMECHITCYATPNDSHYLRQGATSNES